MRNIWDGKRSTRYRLRLHQTRAAMPRRMHVRAGRDPIRHIATRQVLRTLDPDAGVHFGDQAAVLGL